VASVAAAAKTTMGKKYEKWPFIDENFIYNEIMNEYQKVPPPSPFLNGRMKGKFIRNEKAEEKFDACMTLTTIKCSCAA
jgi:hypothetical protein